jgi:hypothetical protein
MPDAVKQKLAADGRGPAPTTQFSNVSEPELRTPARNGNCLEISGGMN